MLITNDKLGVGSLLPRGAGYTPPPPRIPPYYTVRMSYRGDNPLNQIK